MNVVGYDVAEPMRSRFVTAGGQVEPTVSAAAAGAEVLLVLVMNSQQAREALFVQGAAKGASRRRSSAYVVLMRPQLSGRMLRSYSESPRRPLMLRIWRRVSPPYVPTSRSWMRR